LALLLLVGVGVALPSAGQAVAAPQAASSRSLFYTGDAYGTYAFVGSTVVAGKSALVSLGCTTTAGVHNTNTVATVNVPNVISTGAIDTTADSIATGGTVKSRTSADVHDADLLSGLITASEVKAVSTTSHNTTGFHVSAAGSSFVNLVVNGVPITVTPAPNTTIPLPGVGSVVLNEQIKSIGTNKASFTVNMIHVFVTVDLPGIAKGTQIIVAHATSDLELNKAGSLDGIAYGTKAHVGHLVISGPSAVVRMPCGGTNGKVKTNSVASVSIPGVASTGTVTDTAQGTIDATTASGEMTSTVQMVDLLSSLVTADAVKADAHASKTGAVISLSDAGSTFVNLVVNGQPISGDVAPNTKITVGNLTIWLHRVIKTSNSIEVRMIEIIVKGPNPFNLQTGTDIQVAVAEASVH
jgi:hypothetical protein